MSKMIIDFHTHFFPDSLAPRAIEFGSSFPQVTAFTDGTRQGLEDSMRQSGIDVSVCLPLATSPDNVDGINRFAISNNYLPLIMLGTIHPDSENKTQIVAELSQAGINGIKLHPEFQQFTLDDPRMEELWSACIEHDMFIITHAGADIAFPAPYKTNPEKVAILHKKYPELKLVIAHFGSWGMWDEVEKHLIGLPIWLDMGYTGGFIAPDHMANMIRNHGVDKVFFGTDSPWRDQSTELDIVRALPLTEAEKERILGRNAAAFLNL
jgi:uncharacterized protein